MQNPAKFINLFRGRDDVYGKLMEDGSLRCIRLGVAGAGPGGAVSSPASFAPPRGIMMIGDADELS